MHSGKWLALPAALLIGCAVHAQTASTGPGQAYPTKPVRIVVPFAPGGATDIVTRIVAQQLTGVWKQSIVVDNRAGAGGNIGAELSAKATADGYTLFMPSGSVMTANQHMYPKLSFNAEKDFVAITNVASGPQALVTHPSFPARTVKDLIAMAKAKPGAVNFGSAGIGTQTHLAAENFAYTAGINVIHVPYKGEGPALVDLVAGQINYLTPNLSASIGFVKQGKLRALGVTSKQRSPQLPDVPAVAETLPGFENLGWFGLVAPAGTPRAVLAKVHADVVGVLRSAAVKRRFNELGMVPVGNSPAEFAKAMRQESLLWAKVIEQRKLKLK